MRGCVHGPCRVANDDLNHTSRRAATTTKERTDSATQAPQPTDLDRDKAAVELDADERFLCRCMLNLVDREANALESVDGLIEHDVNLTPSSK